MTPEIFWKWVGGTRFAMTAGAGIVDTCLLALGKLPPEIYRDLTLATVAAFIGAAAYSAKTAVAPSA